MRHIAPAECVDQIAALPTIRMPCPSGRLGRWARAFLTWAIVLTGVVTALGQERPAATMAVGELPLRFRRVFVLGDRLREWPRENVAYVPVEPSEFERVLQTIAEATSPEAGTSSAYVRSAWYYARLVNDSLVQGQAVLEVDPIGVGEQAVAARPLEPFGLAAGAITWADRDGQPAKAGRSAAGKQKVVVDAPGILMFSWQASGVKRPDGSIHFGLRFPSATESRVTIDAPSALVPITETLSWSEDLPQEGVRRWVFALGGRADLNVAFVNALSPGQKSWGSWTLVYDLALQGLELSANLRIDSPDRKIDRFEISVPAELTVTNVAAEASSNLSWSVHPVEGKTAENRLLLEFSPPLQGLGQQITIRGVAPAVLARSWALPVLQSSDVAWRQTRLEVRVKPPLRVASAEVQGGFRTVVDNPSASHTTLQFVYDRPDGKVLIVAVVPPAVYTSQSLSWVQISGAELVVEHAVAAQAVQGETWQLRARVSPGWVVESVESAEPNGVRFWQVEVPPPSAAGTCPTCPTLRVDLSRPVPLREPLLLRVRCRQVLTQPALAVSAAELLPVEWEEALTREQWIAIQADRAWRWDPASLVTPAAPGSEVLARLQSTLGLPPDIPVFRVRVVPPLAIYLPREAGYFGWVQTEIVVRDEEVLAQTAIVCFPEPNGQIEEVTVTFASSTESTGDWRVRRCLVEQQSQSQLATVHAAAALPYRMERETNQGRETWHILFDIPVREPVLIQHQVKIPTSDRSVVMLPWLQGARAQELVVGVDIQTDGLLVDGVGTVLKPVWGPMFAEADEGESQRAGEVGRGLWFRYLPPPTVDDKGKPGGPRVHLVRTTPETRPAWIWSAEYDTIFRPKKTLRHRGRLCVESGVPGQVVIRWDRPVRILGLSVDGEAVVSPVFRRELSELFLTGHQSEGVDEVDRQAEARSPQITAGEGAASGRMPPLHQPVAELPVRIPGKQGITFVDILWEEETLPAQYVNELKAPIVSYNLPVLKTLWRVWIPPGWEVETRGSLWEVDVNALARRLFGSWVRKRGEPVFDPLKAQSWVAIFSPASQLASPAEIFAPWSDALQRATRSLALSGPIVSSGEKPRTNTVQTTWGALFKALGSALAGDRPEVQPAGDGSDFVNVLGFGQGSSSARSVALWVDASALASQGIHPAGTVEVPRELGPEVFVDLLATSGLSLIIHPQMWIITSGEVTASISDKLQAVCVNKSRRLLSGQFWRAAGGPGFAPAAQAATSAGVAGRQNPEALSAKLPQDQAPEQAKGSVGRQASLSRSVPTPACRLVVAVAPGELQKVLEQLSVQQALGSLRLVPASLWGDYALAGWIEPGTGKTGWEDVVPSLGWEMQLLSPAGDAKRRVYVVDEVVGNFARVFASVIALATVSVLGFGSPWPVVYWLAGAGCLLLAWAGGGLWAAGAGGWLIGQLLGLVTAALWTSARSRPRPSDEGWRGTPGDQDKPTPDGDDRPFVHTTGEEATGRYCRPGEAASEEATGVCRYAEEHPPEGKSANSPSQGAPERFEPNNFAPRHDECERNPDRLANVESSGTTPPPTSPRKGISDSWRGLLIVAAAGIPTLASGMQAGELPAGPPVPTFRVLIPVDEQGRPTGEKYQVPEPLWTKLSRLASEAKDRWLLTSALYQAQMLRAVDGSTWTIPELRVVFQVEVLQAPCLFPLPLPSAFASELPTVFVNGRPTSVVRTGVEGVPCVELTVEGLSEVRFTLLPTVWRDANYFWLRIPIPQVVQSLLQVFAPAEAPPIQVMKSFGPVSRNLNLGMIEAALGPVDEIFLRWPVYDEPAFPAEARLIVLLSASGEGLIADVTLRFGDPTRTPASVELEVDPDWEAFGPVTELVPVSSPQGESLRLYQWRATGEPPGRSFRRLRFVHRQKDFVGQIVLPFVRLTQLRLSACWVGFVTSSPIQVQPVDPARTAAVAPAAFAEAWGEAVPNLTAVWGIAPESPLPFVVRRTAGKFAGKEFLQVYVEATQVRLQYAAQVELQNDAIFQYALTTPPGFVADQLEVESADGTMPVRGFRTSDNVLVLDIDPPLTSAHRLRVTGICPIADADLWSLPTIRLLRAGTEPLRVDIWAAFGMVVGIKPTVPLQPQPLTPFPLPEEGRFLGGLELETGQEAGVRCSVRLDRPRISGRQITRLERGREGWTAEVIWLLDVSDGSVNRLTVELPRWALGPQIVDPPAEFRVLDLSTSSPGPLGSPGPGFESSGTPASPASGGLTLPVATPASERDGPSLPSQGVVNPSAVKENVTAQIEFERPFSGSRVIRLSKLVAPGARLVRIPLVVLSGVEITEQYLLLPQSTDWHVADLGPEELPEVPLPTELASVVPAAGQRCFRGSPRISRLVVLATRGEPVVRAVFVKGQLRGDGRLLALVQWDVDPMGNTTLALRVPQEVEVLGWHIPGGYASPATGGNDLWYVHLAHPVLPTVVTFLLTARVEMTSLWWTGRHYQVKIPSFVRCRVRESLWMIAPENADQKLELFAGDAAELPLEVVSPKLLTLQRLRSLASAMRIASGELPALSHRDMAWFAAWQRAWKWVEAQFPRGIPPAGEASTDVERDYMMVMREVEKLSALWPTEPLRPSREKAVAWAALLEALPVPPRDLGPLYHCWVDPKGGDTVVIAQQEPWWKSLGGFALLWLLVGACVVSAGFRQLRTRLAGSLRRWPFAWLAGIGLAWWLWLQPSAAGFLLMVAAACGGVFLHSYAMLGGGKSP